MAALPARDAHLVAALGDGEGDAADRDARVVRQRGGREAAWCQAEVEHGERVREGEVEG